MCHKMLLSTGTKESSLVHIFKFLFTNINLFGDWESNFTSVADSSTAHHYAPSFVILCSMRHAFIMENFFQMYRITHKVGTF